MKPGTILLLNGTSSSGKTTLLHLLQEALDSPFLEFGLDKVIWMLPRRYFYPPLWDEVLGKADRAGAFGHQLIQGLHRAMRTLSENGLNVLADHVLVEPAWALDLAEQLSDLPAYLIGIQSSLEILEQREKSRKDRTLGQARAQFDLVHAHGFYDFTVNSGESSAEESLEQILQFLKNNPSPQALQKIKT